MPKKTKSKRVMRPVIEEIIENKPEETSIHETSVETKVESKGPQPEVTAEELPKPQEVQSPKDSGFRISIGFVFLTIVVAVLVAVLSGGLYVYFNGVNSIKNVTPEETIAPTPNTTEPTPQPTQKADPTPSPTPEPKLTTYKVNILNGSGKIGEAGKVKALIEKAGFKVLSTGNAANFSFDKTVIQVKQTVGKQAQASLKDSLKASYSLEDGDTLDAKAAYDIVITVGAE